MEIQQQRRTISVFGLVKKKVGEESHILFVKDIPKNEIEEQNPKIKLSGGNVPEGKRPEDFIQQKIREETNISVILTGKDRDEMGRRKPYFMLAIGFHTFIVYEMESSDYVKDIIPQPGGGVLEAKFLSPSEIRLAVEEKIFLENHLFAIKKYLSSLEEI